MLLRLIPLLTVLAVSVAATTTARAADSFSFAVISQRSAPLTAEYWNPILRHVAERAGVTLHLKLARTGPDHAQAVARGEPDFIYSNHQFSPGNDTAGYRVIARAAGNSITGQLVVHADSPIRSIQELRAAEVVFPSRAAFVGYQVPIDALMRANVPISPIFAGNQEGAMAQLKVKRAPAAGVNSEVMREYANREGFAYRVLWSSEPFKTIPIAVHPRVDRAIAERVRKALVEMAEHPEGATVLAASAALIKEVKPYGFVAASDADYENVRRFHRNSLVPRD